LGILIFYGVGEWYRRKVVTRLREIRLSVMPDLEPLERNWFVLAGLLVGLSVFLYSGFSGGVFLASSLTMPDLVPFLLHVGSILIGFFTAWVLVMAWKTDDAV
jgi:hypothetical protein